MKSCDWIIIKFKNPGTLHVMQFRIWTIFSSLNLDNSDGLDNDKISMNLYRKINHCKLIIKRGVIKCSEAEEND